MFFRYVVVKLQIRRLPACRCMSQPMCVRTSLAIQNLAASCFHSFKNLFTSVLTPPVALDFPFLDLLIP